MASLFRRKTSRMAGRWVLTIDGKQRIAPETVITKTQAIAWAATVKAVEPSKKTKSFGPTIGDLASKWIKHREQLRDSGSLAASTVKDNKSHLQHRIVPDLGDEAAIDLNVPRLRSWVRTLEGAPTTRRNVVSTLASMLDDAIGEGWTSLRVNPARERALRVILPEHKATTRGVDLVISQGVASDLICSDLIPVHRRVRYAIAFLTGLRDGEIAGLRIGDVSDVIRVTQAVQLVGSRKPGKTKTDGSVRIVPVHPQLKKLIAWWVENGWSAWTCKTPTINSPLLPGEDGGWSRPRGANGLRADMERIGATAHVDGHPFCFRHTRTSFASWLRAAGIHRETIGALLGHEGRSVTDRHYALAEIQELVDAVCTIGVVINPVITFVISDHNKSAKPLEIVAPPARVELATNGLGNRDRVVIKAGRRRGYQRTRRTKRDGCSGEGLDNGC